MGSMTQQPPIAEGLDMTLGASATPSGSRASTEPEEVSALRASIPSAATCATCAHIGRIYWGDDDRRIHLCGKSDDRRRDNFQTSGDFADDFMSEFRKFFDAAADQKACRYYEERPPLDEETVALLGTIASAGTAVFGFWSRENALCCKMRGKFVEEDLYPRDPTKGERYWKLSAVGRAVLASANRSRNGGNRAVHESAVGNAETPKGYLP